MKRLVILILGLALLGNVAYAQEESEQDLCSLYTKYQQRRTSAEPENRAESRQLVENYGRLLVTSLESSKPVMCPGSDGVVKLELKDEYEKVSAIRQLFLIESDASPYADSTTFYLVYEFGYHLWSYAFSDAGRSLKDNCFKRKSADACGRLYDLISRGQVSPQVLGLNNKQTFRLLVERSENPTFLGTRK